MGQALHGRHVGLGEGVLADHVLEVAAELDAVEQRAEAVDLCGFQTFNPTSMCT